jgi:Mg/Co/Ni transporter MgtE
MSSVATLTLAYLEQAPASAAKVLQEMGIGEAAAFLETVPARLAAPVVNSMIPAMSARCLERLPVELGAAILRNLAQHDATSLLRLVRVEMRNAILAELPSSMAKRLHRSLQHSLNSVGAWIDPDIPLLSPDHTVDDALRYLRDTRTASHIFLESASNGRFLGTISVHELLRSERLTPLAQLPIHEIAPLSNRMALASAALHPAWDDYLVLPVVGRRHNVLGGLSRTALRRGVHEQHAATQMTQRSVLANLAAALLLTCAGLMRLAVQSGSLISTNLDRSRLHGR